MKFWLRHSIKKKHYNTQFGRFKLWSHHKAVNFLTIRLSAPVWTRLFHYYSKGHSPHFIIQADERAPFFILNAIWSIVCLMSNATCNTFYTSKSKYPVNFVANSRLRFSFVPLPPNANLFSVRIGTICASLPVDRARFKRPLFFCCFYFLRTVFFLTSRGSHSVCLSPSSTKETRYKSFTFHKLTSLAVSVVSWEFWFVLGDN